MSTILTKDFMNAYLAARKSRTPIADQSSKQRAGRFLLKSAAQSSDGHESPQMALQMALVEGEVDASVALAETLQAPSASPNASWKAAPGPKEERASFEVAGSFEVDFLV